MVQILLWYIGQEGYKGKKEKLILRRPYNAGPPQVEEMVKELESKVVEIEAKIAEKVGENIEKTQQAVRYTGRIAPLHRSSGHIASFPPSGILRISFEDDTLFREL